MDKGYTRHVCTKCGYTYTDASTLPVDHFYVDGFCIWCGTPMTGSVMGDHSFELAIDWGD